MVSQSDLLSPHEIAVYHDDDKGGTLKTSNLKGQYQRPIITSRGKKSTDYKATCILKTCVHGHLDSSTPTPIPASLIVLEYSLNALANNKYISAYTELQFSPGILDKKTKPPTASSTNTSTPPQVLAWAPHTSKANLTSASKTKTKDRKFEGLKLDILGNGGELSTSLGNSTTSTGNRTYFQLLQSDKALSAKAGTGADVVWWAMQQNQFEKDGVPPAITCAVLVQRDVGDAKEKFSAKFVLTLEAEKKHAARESWNRFWGIVQDDPVLFDPTLPKVGGEGVDEGHLDWYRVNDDLERMGHFENPPVVEEGWQGFGFQGESLICYVVFFVTIFAALLSYIVSK
ncbi:hypothetical protein EG329_001272 [Mollisiaceae sp. DMI_Dod_QoI]|nr:hypothetical protein EG329_001272 [Helotiales sp. DMI_Dod_QoI]